MVARPGTVTKPASGSLVPITTYLEHALRLTDRTQTEIAKELGYMRPNIVTMWKTGATPVPLNKVEKLAELLGADPKFLMRVVLKSYYPELLDFLSRGFGEPISDNEQEILEFIRQRSNNSDPRLDEDMKTVLETAFAS